MTGTGQEEAFELVPLAAGGYSLRSLANGQTFHPVVGPMAEAQGLHVRGTRLAERARALPPGEEMVVWDVGLGAAANALAAVAAFADEGGGWPGNVRLLSFDRTSAALRFALENADALGYPRRYAADLARQLEAGEGALRNAAGGTLRWTTRLGDFPALLRGPDSASLPAPHAVFYDPYSPTVNPEMWTLEVFADLHARLRDDRPCLLTNYTRSTAVRVTLLLAGFYVGVGPSTGEKDETTVATNDPALLERPFSRDWLEGKVYASTNAAPLRAGGARGPISLEDFDRLLVHPQFVG